MIGKVRIMDKGTILKNFSQTYNILHYPVGIYGTGIYSQHILSYFNIDFVIDNLQTGNLFCGKEIISLEKAIKLGVRSIVIVARPASVRIVYKRIYELCDHKGIFLTDIWGNDLKNVYCVDKYDSANKVTTYYRNTLKKMIDEHSIISFDIFDTLLMRKVLTPYDVFNFIIENWEINFSQIRIKAQNELSNDLSATIYEIYDKVKQIGKISEEKSLNLCIKEIEFEQRILVPRIETVSMLFYAIKCGKKVILTSDTYFTEEILENFLQKHNILGYDKIFASCVFGSDKEHGLFQKLLSNYKEEKVLHIGDNQISDVDMALKYGLTAFYLPSALEILRQSPYSKLLSSTVSLSDRIVLGLITCKIFNSPFDSVDKVDGRVVISSSHDFGYAFLGPLLTKYTIYLVNKIKDLSLDFVIFPSRDGYILQKLYSYIKDILKLPDYTYLYTSRVACIHHLDNNDAYVQYLRQAISKNAQKIAFIDFCSTGTCQSYLSRILEKELFGVYFQRLHDSNIEKQVQTIFGMLDNEDNSPLEANYFFFETLVSSPEGSFITIDNKGNMIFEEDVRGHEQIKAMVEVQGGAEKFFRDFLLLYTFFDENISDNFLKRLLGLMGSGTTKLVNNILDKMVYADELFNRLETIGR